MREGETTSHVAAILNRGYMLRYYCRPGQEVKRAEAIRALGLAVRAAFKSSDNFEPLLAAVLDALDPRAPRF